MTDPMMHVTLCVNSGRVLTLCVKVRIEYLTPNAMSHYPSGDQTKGLELQ
jgi:hypothetical protein